MTQTLSDFARWFRTILAIIGMAAVIARGLGYKIENPAETAAALKDQVAGIAARVSVLEAGFGEIRSAQVIQERMTCLLMTRRTAQTANFCAGIPTHDELAREVTR